LHIWSATACPPWRDCRRFPLPDAPCRIKIPRGSELQLRQKTAARSAFLSRRSSRELSLSPRSEGAQPLWSPGAGPPRACRRFLLPDAPCRIKIPRGSELQLRQAAAHSAFLSRRSSRELSLSPLSDVREPARAFVAIRRQHTHRCLENRNPKLFVREDSR